METVSKHRLVKIDTKGLAEVYQVDNFLTVDECNYIIKLIELSNHKSQVVAENNVAAEYSEARTSSSSNLPMEDIIVKKLNFTMHSILPEFIPIDRSETPQGQRYLPGEFFNDHFDYFDKNMGSIYKQVIGSLGQRNWTLMLYLNDVVEGGETDFPKLGLKFKPKRGRAIIWRNTNRDGSVNPNTLHAGRPPISGTKYIITKWFRDGNTDIEPFNANEVKTERFDIQKDLPAKHFRVKEDLPKFSEKGFKIIDLPQDIWGYIQDIYKLVKNTETSEADIGDFIKSDIHKESTSIMNMDQVPYLKKYLHELIKPIMEEWCNCELEPSTCYGIRNYKEGSILQQHYDRLSELHISGIILVDEKSNTPWALEIQDHFGNWESIVIKPGQMILYESAICSHGRNIPFNGEYFRNFFIHYKLTDWTYVGN